MAALRMIALQSKPRRPPSRLVGVPKPFPFEAVSVWASRFALSQGARLAPALRFLNLDGRADTDRVAHGDRLQRVRAVAGLDSDAFAIADRIATSLASMGSVGANFMAVEPKHLSRFRFCVCCLTEMRTPHFPIHWRFIGWRRCPIHDCLLEDVCPHCRAPIVFPADIEHSAAGRSGVASLRYCLVCARRLTDIKPCFLQAPPGGRLVHPFEDLCMANGRALLAALVRGSFHIQGHRGAQRLTALRFVARYGVLPTRLDWLPPQLVRARLARATASGAADGSQVWGWEYDKQALADLRLAKYYGMSEMWR